MCPFQSWNKRIPQLQQLGEKHLMRLGQLFPHELVDADHADVAITGLALDTRHLAPGYAFVALKGGEHDGRNYLMQALEKGASALVCEAEDLADFSLPSGIPLIAVPQLSTQLETLARQCYPSAAALPVIGVTGTNGKTTTGYLLAQALSVLGVPTGFVGTIGYGFVGDLQPCALTTPDIFTLHRSLCTLQTQGAQGVTMEISSHGLAQNRVNALTVESAIFTNLTQDHLDYHHTMEAYCQAKQKLFEFSTLRQAIINIDSPYSDAMIRVLAPSTECIKYSVSEQVRSTTFDKKGITADLKTPWGAGILRSPLCGSFNLANLLAVLSQLCARGIPLSLALEALGNASAPPGRMECIQTPRAYVIIDYAHTPDALEKALQAARVHTSGQLWCVFGCGGDRDRTKRAKMGAACAQYADHSIVTSDNPRSEDPEAIIADILQGMVNHSVQIEHNRAKAIEMALAQAVSGDTILIAGKGHENYQIIGDKKFPFSDAQTVKAMFQEKAV